jgi:hypothetical protein
MCICNNNLNKYKNCEQCILLLLNKTLEDGKVREYMSLSSFYFLPWRKGSKESGNLREFRQFLETILLLFDCQQQQQQQQQQCMNIKKANSTHQKHKKW